MDLASGGVEPVSWESTERRRPASAPSSGYAPQRPGWEDPGAGYHLGGNALSRGPSGKEGLRQLPVSSAGRGVLWLAGGLSGGSPPSDRLHGLV